MFLTTPRSRISQPDRPRMRPSTTLGVLCLIGLSACHNYPAPPRHPSDDPKFKSAIDMRPAGMRDLPPEPIKVLPGDHLSIRAISADETLYEDLIVDELGNIHVPLVGDVPIANLSLTDAEASVQKALRRYDSVVRVSIQITDAQGHRATVIGSVQNPGVHTVSPGMRLAELMALCGGPISGGDENLYNVADVYAARLVREGKILPVSIPAAMAGDPRHNVRIRPGDHLYVPPVRGDTITVLGEAAQPKLVLYRPQLRLSQVLAIAGGLHLDARLRDVRIIRGSMDDPSIYKVSQNSLARGNAVDIEVAPGDIVFVGRRGLAEMREVLTALGPLLTLSLSAGILVPTIKTIREDNMN